MKARLKHLLRSFLRSRGLDLVRTTRPGAAEPPLAGQLTDQLFCTSQECVPALAVPVELLGWDNGFTLGPGGWNPYLAAAREYLSGTARRYEESSLCSFYAAFTPATAAEYLSPTLPAGSVGERYSAAVAGVKAA
ncbi:MAG: hypothetical protein E4H18_04155 [Hyphomicrobiales bacterium]|nr:MAG: hypothetical protein E4H18_04155 [Hyphomicrobiales bacterium]